MTIMELCSDFDDYVRWIEEAQDNPKSHSNIGIEDIDVPMLRRVSEELCRLQGLEK